MLQPAATFLPLTGVDYDRTLVLAIELSSKNWVLAAQVPGLLQTKARRPSSRRRKLCLKRCMDIMRALSQLVGRWSGWLPSMKLGGPASG
jgi:hypothetical protein